MIESILADLLRYLDISSIKGKDEAEGHHILQVLEHTEVWVKDLNPGCYLRSTISPLISPDDREDFYIYLMKANFLGQGTGGGVISIDPNEKFLILSQTLNYEINYRIFRDKLEDFVNYLDFWREEIQKWESKKA